MSVVRRWATRPRSVVHLTKSGRWGPLGEELKLAGAGSTDEPAGVAGAFDLAGGGDGLAALPASVDLRCLREDHNGPTVRAQEEVQC